jgi:hypothetical protein
MEHFTAALSGFTRTNAIAYSLVSDIEKMSFVVLAPDPHQRVQHAAILPDRLTLHPGTSQDLQLSVLPWLDYFMTVGATTLNTTTHSITTLGIMTLSIYNTGHNDTQHTNKKCDTQQQHSAFCVPWHCAEGCYAYCCCIIVGDVSVSPSK